MARGVASLTFWGKGEVADVRTILHLLWLVECQHVQGGIALHQLFNVVLQQWADNNAGAVLLNLRQNLIERLRTGVINLQLSAWISGCAGNGLRLCGGLLFRRCCGLWLRGSCISRRCGWRLLCRRSLRFLRRSSGRRRCWRRHRILQGALGRRLCGG
ncbi:hypothetical protein D3C86_1391610 [compost metagenome]